jgi:hypothetical protein
MFIAKKALHQDLPNLGETRRQHFEVDEDFLRKSVAVAGRLLNL